MEALSSSEASVLTRVTRRNIPEDAIVLLLLLFLSYDLEDRGSKFPRRFRTHFPHCNAGLNALL
jgi:hypothetical protein